MFPNLKKWFSILAVISSEFSLSVGWSFDTQEKWSGTCKTGIRQSPINISEKMAEDWQISPIEFKNLEESVTAIVSNRGTGVIVQIIENELQPILSGCNLRGSYTFESLHVHWPAEHYLGNRRNDVEAHLIFYSNEFENITVATNYESGIAVVALFFNINLDGENSADEQQSDLLTEIANAAIEVRNRTDVRRTINEFVLGDLFPSNTNGFYSYFGSLTTPQCNEVVEWFIIDGIGSVSQQSFNKLTNMCAAEGKRLNFNSRHIQRINERQVYYTGFDESFNK